MYLRLASNYIVRSDLELLNSSLSLSYAGVAGVNHHAQFRKY